MFNPNGLHIQNKHTLPRDQMLAHQQRAHYLTHTILDDYKFAVQMADAGLLYPVHRDSAWEPGELAPNVSRTHIKQYAEVEYRTLKAAMQKFESDDRRLLHMVNCEHDLTDARLWMYVELMRLSANDPEGVIGFVFANEAAGSEAHGYWVNGHNGYEYVHSSNVWTRPARIDYLKALHQYRDLRLKSGARAFLDGEHGYTYRYVNFAVNGGQNKGLGHHRDWLDQALEINWSLPQDHLGRKLQAQYHALGWEWSHASRIWNPSSKHPHVTMNGQIILPPYKIVTEQLIDNMEGGGAGAVVDEGLIFAPPYTKAWGYNSMRPTWQRWYPEFEPGETLARMTEWAWTHIYQPTGFYIGSHTFTCGDTASGNPLKEGQGWTPHNLIGLDGVPDQSYFDYMETQHGRVDVQEGLPVAIQSIDIAQYICGKPGRAHLLTSGELCMTLFDPLENRRFRFAKNSNTEEMAVFKHTDGIEYIWRGLDTSRSADELYFITEGGKPGARWCPRFWREGQSFQRENLVTVKGKADCKTRHVYVDKSFLKLVKYHASYRFPSGITLPDVIELTWFYQPEDQTLERYWYALGWGLVGWTDHTGAMKTWVVSLNPSGTPQPQTWCDIAPIVVPKEIPVPVYVSPKDDVIPAPIGTGIVATVTAERNIRNRPETAGVDMGDLRIDQRVTYYPNTKRVSVPDNLEWYWTEDATGKAWWAADLPGEASLFKPVPVIPPPNGGPTVDELEKIFVTRAELNELIRQYVAATFAPKAAAGS